ncbi:Rieske (2Fe-2S) protein [Nocardia uniformis]|uniref:Cytochrome bc1 complex Rieske iron-sulfur subunit n=1 Tax=Nocardia uniformis TaxID=53432 RepID=A0A849C0V5_9NOCA|nr:Rieske (2Fe-2S) protein [Nocardia uniformis]NNH69975.1 Rieske (2Fe-2S) protein [Nocardia uniformis]
MSDLPAPTRRTVLAGGCALTLAGVALGSTACTSSSAAGHTSFTVPTTDIPVGGGTVFRDHTTVITQPTPGEYHAFSAVCPHQRCTVNAVRDDLIHCPCHGSRFRIADGSVQEGPARTGLTTRTVTVTGDTLRID